MVFKAKKNPFVSIIIPAYNEEKHIKECLASIKNQTYTKIELIVVDDGSIDDTKNIAKKYADIVVEQEHLGLGNSRNKGAKYAKGFILVFLDADMYFDKNYVKNLIKPIVNAKTYATYTNDEYLANSNNIWVICGNIDNDIPHGQRYFNTKESLTVRAITKRLFFKLGGMKTNLGYRDDYIFLGTKYRALPAPGAICYHHNPDTLRDVFESAKWIGKNPIVSKEVKSLLRYSVINSMIISSKKIKNGAPIKFLIYKFVFDFGILCGILSANLNQNYAK